MNVLFIRSTGGFSGAEKYNLSLIQGYKKKAYPINFTFLTDNEAFKKHLEKEHIIVFLVRTYLKEVGTKKEFLYACLLFPFFLYQYIKVIFFLLGKKKMHIICLESTTEKIFLSPFLKLFQFKIMWIEHGPIYITDRFILVKFLYKLMSNVVSLIISVSEDTRADLLSNNIAPSKLRVIPSAVDTSLYQPVSKEKKEEIKKTLGLGGKYIVGYCGSITKEKGIDLFPAVAEIIIKKRKDIKFLLVGSGSYINLIKKNIFLLGLEKYFIFTGFQEDVKEYLSIFDLFFFPTQHNEGLPLALLEAAAMELPILAHDIGGNREIVLHRETGFLYTTNDKNMLATSLISLLNDNPTRILIGKQARKLILKKYDVKIMAERYFDAFHTL